ncbi:MAG: glycosyl transferase, partial [Devosiaceae bacterium]|nr:glycosyl transferase [Devosiaceae bacterium MH13]
MADFHQNGNITTLHDLRQRSADDLAHEVSVLAASRKVTLILPCLYSELEGPAMPGILAELSKVRYLHRIIIGLDAASEEQYRKARSFFSALPQD